MNRRRVGEERTLRKMRSHPLWPKPRTGICEVAREVVDRGSVDYPLGSEIIRLGISKPSPLFLESV